MKKIARMFTPFIMVFALIAGFSSPAFAEKIEYSGYLLDDVYQFGVKNPVSQAVLSPLTIVRKSLEYAGDNWNLGK